MPDEPKKPEAQAQEPKKEVTPPPPASPMDLIHEVTSLEDLKDLPVTNPEPLQMVWEQSGKVCRMKVGVRRPGKTSSAYASLRIEYLAAKRKAETPIFDTPNAVARFPDEGIHNKLLRDRCIIYPAFLKNDGIEKSDVLPPEFWASLDLKLLPVAGLDGDFFYDWESLQTPKAFMVQQLESLAKLEESSRMKSSPDAPTPAPVNSTTPVSPPSTDGPGNFPSSVVSSESKTPSGSVSPPPPSQVRTSSRPPIRVSGRSLEKNPLPQERLK